VVNGLSSAAELARRYSLMTRRITSEALTCSWAARSTRARFSSGSSRTDSTEAAVEPSGGRPPVGSAAECPRHSHANRFGSARQSRFKGDSNQIPILMSYRMSSFWRRILVSWSAEVAG
jgi:hypothetical protein